MQFRRCNGHHFFYISRGGPGTHICPRHLCDIDRFLCTPRYTSKSSSGLSRLPFGIPVEYRYRKAYYVSHTPKKLSEESGSQVSYSSCWILKLSVGDWKRWSSLIIRMHTSANTDRHDFWLAAQFIWCVPSIRIANLDLGKLPHVHNGPCSLYIVHVHLLFAHQTLYMKQEKLRKGSPWRPNLIVP